MDTNTFTNRTKFTADEAGPWSSSGARKITIRVPSNVGFVDLESSTLNLVCKMKTTGAADLDLRPYNLALPPELLFESVKEKFDGGIFIEQPFQNIVKASIDKLTISRQQELAAANLGMSTSYYRDVTDIGNGGNAGLAKYNLQADDFDAQTGLPYMNGTFSPFWKPSVPSDFGAANARDVATTPSVVTTPEIQIPLKSLSTFAKSSNASQQFPFAALGDYTLTLDLDSDIEAAIVQQGTYGGALAGEFVSTWDICGTITVSGTDLSGANLFTVDFSLDDPTGHQSMEKLSHIDIGAGSAWDLKWGASSGAGGAGSRIIKIDTVTANGGGTGPNDYHVTFSITDTSGFPAGYDKDTLSQLSINVPTVDPPTLEIISAELDLTLLKIPQQKLPEVMAAMRNLQIDFPEYVVNTDTMPTTLRYSHTDLVPIGSRGLAVLTPEPILSRADILKIYSSFDNVQSYRFQVSDRDGNQYWTSDVPVPTYYRAGRGDLPNNGFFEFNNMNSLQLTRLMDFYENSGMELMKFSKQLSFPLIGGVTPNDFGLVNFYPQMLVPMNESQPVTVVLNTDGVNAMAGKTVYFVYYRGRKIFIKNGVMSME